MLENMGGEMTDKHKTVPGGIDRKNGGLTIKSDNPLVILQWNMMCDIINKSMPECTKTFEEMENDRR